MKRPTLFEIKHYNQLIGKTIKSVEFTTPDGMEEPEPTLVFTDGTCAAVLCDPEGNGPGHLALFDLKTGAELAP